MHSYDGPGRTAAVFPRRRRRVTESNPALQGGTLGKSTVENVGDVIGSALGKAWREATEPASEPSPKRSNGTRSNGTLSGMRGVIVGAGLGVLAAKKAGPVVKNAMLKYVASHATGATDQVDVPSTDQAAAGSPAT